MRHAPGLHQADTLKETPPTGRWKAGALAAWAVVTLALALGGAILAHLAIREHSMDLYDWGDAINHTAFLLAVGAVVAVCWIARSLERANESLMRANESLMRAMRAANRAAGLPDPAEPAAPAARDRDAA